MFKGMMINSLRIVALNVLLSTIIACGGGSDKSTPPPPPQPPAPKIGLLIDAAIQGMNFSSSSGEQGQTNARGEYTYFNGDTIIFSFAGITFPSIQAQAVTTPFELLQTQNIYHKSVVNLLRLLQSLDDDGDISVSIQLSQSKLTLMQSAALSYDDLFLSVDEFEQRIINSEVFKQADGTQNFVPVQSAIEHFKQTLSSSNKIDSDADGITNANDNDDDNDGVDDVNDALPWDPSETLDTDSDNLGNNLDPDDDNDGIEDNQDVFPLDAAESKDTDNDSVGDNSDAYPSQSACSKVSDGDGSECYLTWLSKQVIEQTVVTEEGLVFFKLTNLPAILAYDETAKAFTLLDELLIDADSITKIAYSQAHKRLYVGYQSGKIAYWDLKEQQVSSDFASTTEAVGGLAAVGNFLLAQDGSGAWASHYIFDQSGLQTDWVEWNYYSQVYEWNAQLARVYFFKDNTSPNDLQYEEINQSTGKITAEAETPYHGDYSIIPPIKASKDGSKILIGSGDIYDAQSLTYVASLGTTLDDALWLESGELVTVKQQDQSIVMRRFSSELKIIEAKAYTGNLLGLFTWSERNVIVYFAEGTLTFVDYAANNDVDGDGINNVDDAFPDDIAASLDSDNDGYPDSWTTGYSENDSVTGLKLDAFITDSACQLIEHGIDGVCDIARLVVPNEVTKATQYKGVLYLLSPTENTVYKWDIATVKYLNPVLLDNNEISGLPSSLAIIDETTLLVGYEQGALIRYQTGSSQRSQVVNYFSDAVHEIEIGADKTLVIVGNGGYYRDYHVLDSDYKIVNSYSYGRYSNDYGYNSATERFYWFTNSYSDSLESFRVNQQSGVLYDSRSFSYNSSPTLFMAVSADDSLIVTGNARVIRNYLESPTVFNLPTTTSINGERTLQSFVWLSDIAVSLEKIGGQYYLIAYNLALTKTLFEMAVEADATSQQLSFDKGVVLLNSSITNINYQVFPLLSDQDEDGMPFWWELSYGLNDNDNADALLDDDQDELTNSAEFSFGTSPILADTDGDGLSDKDETSVYLLNPLAADTDGDFMDDAWEVANGLDANDATDALADDDKDGVENYYEFIVGTDPKDAASVPEFISDVAISFEDGELPLEWQISGETDLVSIDSAMAVDGSKSLLVKGDLEVVWAKFFSPVDLSFSVISSCYSAYDAELTVELDGQQIQKINPGQAKWQNIALTLASGYHSLRLSIKSQDDSCGLRIDAVKIAPLKSIFNSGVSMVTQEEQFLKFLDYAGKEVKRVAIPEHTGDNNYAEHARDIVILDDGRIAVFNGTYTPKLSVYTPQTHQWVEIDAPAWSTSNNSSYGGITAIGKRVLASNMSTSGNSTNGIVVFDLEANTVNYVEGANLQDLSLGLDGFVYGFANSTIYQYRANDLSLIQSQYIDSSENIVVAQSGDIYAVSWSGNLSHYSSNGELLNSLELDFNVSDMDLRANGDILLSTPYANLYQTTVDLVAVKALDSTGNFSAYVPDKDSDNDGLPDWWEGGNNLNAQDRSDAGSDKDNDGLTALEEYSLRTIAIIADTDGDGVNDGDEYLVYGSNPLVSDTDADGLADGIEAELGTSLTNIDTDADGLSDSVEYNTYFTNPLLADTDGDLMLDAYEIEHELNPLLDDSTDDVDGDGLNNLAEHDAGTDPNNSDTDDDSLSDYDELFVYTTSPLISDSDGDQLPDNWEIAHGLDANDAADAQLDADTDLFSNYEEFFASSDPNDASSLPAPQEWDTYQGGAQHLGYTPMILDEADFAYKWETIISDVSAFNPVTATHGQVFASGVSYFGDQGIYALDSSSGDIQWQMSFDGIHSIDPPAYHNGQVFFQTGGHEDSFIRGVDALTGELNFISSYGNQWSRYMAPTPYAGNVYMAGGYYGGVYAFNETSGQQNWFTGGPQYDGFTPAVDENYVYAFTTKLEVLDRQLGTLVFDIEFPDFNWGGYDVGMAAVLTNLKNIVAIQRGTLVVFDVKNRSVKWQKGAAGFAGQPSSANGKVYAISNGTLKVFDELSGDSVWLWGAKVLESNIIVTKSHLFVGDNTTTYALDLASQKVVWSYPAAGQLSLSAEGILYIAGTSLVAIAIAMQ